MVHTNGSIQRRTNETEIADPVATCLEIPATVGSYSMTNGQGIASQVDEITNNGDIAVNVTVPNTAQLASLDSLYVVNPSNGNFGAEYMANLPDIAAAVNGGMNLIIFDRYVTNAQTILPGGSGITSLRNFASATDVNVAAGAPTAFTNGPNGVIDDTTFDGGNYSNHGYVELSSLPPGGTPLLTTSDPTHIVAFTYPVGAGNVFYSTMPIDYYTGVNNPAISPADIFTLFGNVEEILCFTRGALIETARGQGRLRPCAWVTKSLWPVAVPNASAGSAPANWAPLP